MRLTLFQCRIILFSKRIFVVWLCNTILSNSPFSSCQSLRHSFCTEGDSHICIYLSPVIIAVIVYLVIKAKTLKRALIFGLLFFLLLHYSRYPDHIPVGYKLLYRSAIRIYLISDYSLLPGSLYVKIRDRMIVSNLFSMRNINILLVGISIIFTRDDLHERNKVWQSPLSCLARISLKEILIRFVPGLVLE